MAGGELDRHAPRLDVALHAVGERLADRDVDDAPGADGGADRDRRGRLDPDDPDVVALGRPQARSAHEPAAAHRHDDRERARELRSDLDADRPRPAITWGSL